MDVGDVDPLPGQGVADARAVTGLNRWKQHPDSGGVDGTAARVDGHADGTAGDEVAGAAPIRREVERAFWGRIAEGMTSEDAGVAVGVSGPVGPRWFRERGGMPLISLEAPSARYLSFAEREEIALLRAQDHGVREIARRLNDELRILECVADTHAMTRRQRVDLKREIGLRRWALARYPQEWRQP